VVKIAGIFAMTYPTLFMNTSAAIAKFAAATSLHAVSMACRRAGSPLGQSTYYTSMLPSLAAPRARLAGRLRNFATNRHEIMWAIPRS
jgi:hypothetical protein